MIKVKVQNDKGITKYVITFDVIYVLNLRNNLSVMKFVTMHPKIASFRTPAEERFCLQDVTARCQYIFCRSEIQSRYESTRGILNVTDGHLAPKSPLLSNRTAWG